MIDITVEVYKKDARKKTGERLVKKTDHQVSERTMLEHTYRTTYRARDGYRLEFHETYVIKQNLMGGKEFTERYDTPYYCSPSSESYWSM